MKKYIYFVFILSIVLIFSTSSYAVTGDISIEGRLDINNSSAVPFHIVTNASTPTGANNGEFFIDSSNMLFLYDSTRAKWLSVETTMLKWGYNGNANGAYLRFGGDVTNVNAGPRMPYNGTIVAVSIKQTQQAARTFTLYINGVATANTWTTASPGAGGYAYGSTTTNIDVNAGDFLGILNQSSLTNNPIAILWVKWRK